MRVGSCTQSREQPLRNVMGQQVQRGEQGRGARSAEVVQGGLGRQPQGQHIIPCRLGHLCKVSAPLWAFGLKGMIRPCSKDCRGDLEST